MDSKSAPPQYEDAMSEQGLLSSKSQFQIQTTGVTMTSSLSCRGPDPIGVYRVLPGDHAPSHLSSSAGTPEYVSVRLRGNSNSCALVRGSDPNGTPINSTIYRWGPGRCPRIRMFSPNTSLTIEEAIKGNGDSLECDIVDVKSRAMGFSRTQAIETSFGKFQWRYGSRADRREVSDAHNLLILETMEERPRRIAQLVRSDEFRTPGTDKWMMGNGGRLMMDLSAWEGEKKTHELVKVEAFVVAGCICMLKKEVDRMREGATAAIS